VQQFLYLLYCPLCAWQGNLARPLDILNEIDVLEDHGVREIMLLGQNVNSYRWTQGDSVVDFPRLLRTIARYVRERHGGEDTRGMPYHVQQGIGWIRFLTSHPKDLSSELIEVIKEESIFVIIFICQYNRAQIQCLQR